MNAKEAVAKRIRALCEEHGIAVNALANVCGIPPSTIYSMLGAKSQNPGVVTIQKICDGLEISLREFFDDPVFEELEPIIQ
jgi:transcriptional regulator with XRE-family HTH domain